MGRRIPKTGNYSTKSYKGSTSVSQAKPTTKGTASKNHSKGKSQSK